MDAFEEIVGKLLLEDNYWVRHSVKINLSKNEKLLIGKPTTPRPEIDIVAFCHSENILYLIEVKSLLDSGGVKEEELFQENVVQTGRYKLLTSENYRNIISNRLRKDWISKGLINAETKINYGLVAARIYRDAHESIKENFSNKGWLFWGPIEVKARLLRLVTKGYENSQITVLAKLFIRD